MRARRGHPEAGSSLILALAMITIISVAIVAVLGYAATSFRTVHAINEQRDRSYAADAAVETAIASLRKVADQGADKEQPCSTVNYAAVGDAPSVTVSCQVVGARGPGIPGDTMPPYALWSVGGNIDAGGTTLYVGGPVSSTGSINVGTLDATGYIVRSSGGCSGTITVLDPEDNECGDGSAPDPDYPSRPTPDTSDLANFNPDGICSVGGTLQFRPGIYTEASTFEDPDYGGCTPGFLYFRPGVYYFDFGFADDDHVWNMTDNGSMTIVGGEPKGWNPNGGTPGGALGALGDQEGAACQTERDSLSAEGVQWILGGESQIDASGATVELCAKASAPESGDQQISVYSQLTGTTASPQDAGFEPGRAGSDTGAPWSPDPPSSALRIDPPPPSFAQATIRRTPVADRETSITLSDFGLDPIPRGSRINSVTLRVSHRELAAATPPPNPADLASLKLQLTNGLGDPCTVQDLAPNFTADPNAAFAAPVFDITACLNTTAKLDGAEVAYAATLRDADTAQPVAIQLDGMEIDVGYVRPTIRRLDGADPTFRIGSGSNFVNWGTYYTPIGTLSASGPVQFRRGAIAQSIDASGVPEGGQTRAFCLGYGPKCKQGPSRTLRYTASTGDGPPRLIALIQYFDAPTVGQGVRVWSWNVGRT